MRVFVLACGLSLVAHVAIGQSTPRFSVGTEGAYVWARSDAAGQTSLFTGPALGGQGRVDIGPILLSGGYREGRLTLSGGTAHRDLVEGVLAVGARPVSWFEVSVGPFARAYVTDTTTERWVLWELRTRFESPAFSPGLTSYLELWRAISSQVNAPEGAGRVQGGEVGVLFHPRWFLTARLAYRIDDSLLGTPGRSETVEALTLGLGIATGGR